MTNFSLSQIEVFHIKIRVFVQFYIWMSCPGIGEISAATLIAEIGDFNDFSSGDKLASWLGIVPNVYQSADKYHNGRITKRGSKVTRWMLTPGCSSSF